jgi:flagella basal body P-ring formation protein FlgA
LLNSSRAQAERILIHALRNELKASLAATELALAEFEIQLRDEDAMNIAGTSYADWKIAGWAETLEQPHHLTLVTKNANANHRPILFTCLVKMPPKALVVKSPLPAGHVIGFSDLMWTYSKQEGESLSVEQIVGMEARHALRPGNPISLNDLRTKPYVRTRDLVTVRAVQGGIIVKRTMRALGTGGIGETVELVTLDGKDRFVAKVTGYHETEVLESQPDKGR